MEQYLEECAEVFLKDQGKLFDEPVAETIEEAKEFWKTALHRYLKIFQRCGHI